MRVSDIRLHESGLDAFGENTDGGVTYRLSESHAKIYAEVRYHHAAYNKISTNILAPHFWKPIVNDFQN